MRMVNGTLKKYQRGQINRSISVAEIRTYSYEVLTDSFIEKTFEMDTRIRSPDRVRRILNREQKDRYMIIKILSIRFIKKTYAMDLDAFIEKAQLINMEEEL